MKRLLSLFLVVAMMFSFLAIPASAKGTADASENEFETFESDVQFESEPEQKSTLVTNKKSDTEVAQTSYTVNGFTYEVNDKKATITGYSKTNVTSLTIPEKLGGYPVVGIAGWAFSSCSELTSITVPDSVVYIGQNAFADTPWYENQADGVVYIGNVLYDYKNKEAMPYGTKISVKEGTVSISESAFWYCENLQSVTMPDTVIEIGVDAFSGCYSLESVTLSQSLEKIGDAAFYYCASLASVDLPDGVTNLGHESFAGCSSLTEVTIPASVSECLWPFNECENLSKMIFEEGTTTVPAYIAYGCNALTQVVIPQSVTEIGYGAFYECSSLESVALPEGLEKIGDVAFCDCVSLASVDLPDGVTDLGQETFAGCSSLTEVTIPASVSECLWPFRKCENLSKMIFAEGTTTVPAYIAYGCNALTQVVIPQGVTEIGYGAFYECSSLESVALPKSLEKIGDSAFYDCVSLASVDLPDGVTNLGQETFAGCSSLTEVTIPASVSECLWPFRKCENLSKMIFAEGTTTVPDYIAYGCNALTQVVIPQGVTEIGYGAFYECSSLESVALPEGLEKIGDSVFYDCVSLASVDLPDGVTNLGQETFAGCSSLTEVTIPASVSECLWPFNECENLSKMIFAEGTTTVPAYIAYGCNALTQVVIPQGVTEIGQSAFYDCSSLQSVVLPASLEEIGWEAFYNCSKDLVVYCPKYSFATIHFIDNGYGSISNNDNRLIQPQVLDVEESSFNITSGVKLNVNCNYSIKDEVFENASEYCVKIYIPDGASVEDGSLYLDKKLLTDYEEDNNFIRVPVSKKNGKITFNLSVYNECKLRTYALLEYRIDGEDMYDIIDVINEDIDLISISAEEVVSTEKVEVSGVAPLNSEVEIYVDNEFVSTLESNKIGMYKGEIEIPDPEDDSEYIIKAVSYDSEGTEVFAQTKVIYRVSAPVLKDFTMEYNGNSFDLMGSNKNAVTFVPGNPFTFEAKYENSENIGDVYFTSTRNQLTKTVKATYSESKKAYVFSGYFDNNDHNYVPGKISVSYTPVKGVASFEEMQNIDYSSPKYTKNVSEPIKDVINGDVEDCIENLEVEENKVSGVIKLVDINTYLDFNILTDVIPSYLDPENAGEHGYEAVEDDLGVKMYMKVAENCEDKIKGEIIDFASGKLTEFLIDGGHIDASIAVDNYFAFTSALGYMNDVIEWDNNRTNIKDLKNKIMVSDMSATEKQLALEKLDIANKQNNGVVAVSALSVILTVAGVAIPFPASMILPMLAMSNSNLVDQALGEFAFLNGGISSKKANFNWTVDPSGYVYEAVTSNRVAGATVTAYWIPYDEEIADFWENPDESKSQKWDAGEYSQVNPLITDDDGNYAWDVPEGLWKVVVEKDGFETYETEWLPVPPPQTQVHIGLTSTETPVVESAELTDSAVEVTFSQYMNPETVSTVEVKDIFGKNVEYTLDYSKDEKSLDGTVYAKSYTLSFAQGTEISSVYIPVSVENYVGKSVIAHGEVYAQVQLQLGDVDGDGKINITDASLIQRHIAQLTTIDDDRIVCADVNKDGKINITDATLIQKYIAKLIPEL